MKALVVTCRDPFRPANHRTALVVRRRRSLRNLAPRDGLPVVCQLNGEWISRKAWNRRLRDGDSVLFVTLPQGNNGAGSVIMIIVRAILAYFTMGMSEVVFNVVYAAAGILVSKLLAPPDSTKAQKSSSFAAASPTYSLSAQGNQARIGQPIPVIYGRHIVFPNYGAAPYTEYAGNEQYLYQLFVIGQGEYEIEAIRIEDTSISGFEEITYQIVPPGGSVTLFPTSVSTSGEVIGQEALTNTALGPFVANDAGTATDTLAIDVVFPRGLYYANDDGGLSAVSITWTVEAQAINDDGVAIGAWTTLGTPTVSASTTTPQRKSYRYAVAAGRYQVRLTRTSTKQTDSRYGHELDWAGLRAYLPGTQNYGNVTMLAMRMRATNNLSEQSSRKVNVIATRKLKTWHPSTGWSASAVATRSIAWAIADICRADYGASLADARIDLQGLYDLDAIWTARGDTFNAVFDSQSTVMEALTLAARAGRAMPYMQGGILHIARDAPATIPVAMFSQRNIIKNSFKLEYIMPSEETADCVDVTYFDETVWRERTVRATLPGGTSLKPATVKLFGVTNRAQAWREGMYTAACNKYRRRIPTFQSEMEGFIPAPCDLLAVQHDLPKWGQAGEIVAWNAATKEATLSEPLDWTAGGPHVLAFRKRDGSVAGPYSAAAGTDNYHVTLSDWVVGTDPTPDTASDRERSHFSFGPANAQYIRCRMVSMRAKSPERSELECVVESDYVHTADTGAAPDASAWQLPSTISAPVVLGLSARSMPGASEKMLLSWQPAPSADHYVIEQSSDGEAWTRTGDTAACNYTATALYGAATIIRVAAVGLLRGPWVQVNYALVADYMWINDSNLMWTNDSNTMWRY